MMRGSLATFLAALLAPAVLLAQAPGSPASSAAGVRDGEPSFAPAWGFLAYDNDSFALTPSDFGQCRADPDRARVYCGVKSGKVLAFDSRNGHVAWVFETRGAVRGRPARVDGNLFIASADGCLYRLDAATGRSSWDKPFCADAAFYGDVVAYKGHVYAASVIDKVYAVDAATGAFQWEVHRERPRLMSAEGVASPMVAGGRLLVGFSDGSLEAVDADTGRTAWQADLSRDVRGASDADATPVEADGIVYASAFGEGPTALRLSDGQRLWHAREFGGSRPLVAGDVLVLGTADGTVVGLRRADGSVKWRTRLQTTDRKSVV